MDEREEKALAKLARARARLAKAEARERALKKLAYRRVMMRDRYELLDEAADVRRTLPGLDAKEKEAREDYMRIRAEIMAGET